MRGVRQKRREQIIKFGIPQKVGRESKGEPFVWAVGVDLSRMNLTRTHNHDISRLEQIDSVFDMIFHIAFDQVIDFCFRMNMRIELRQIGRFLPRVMVNQVLVNSFK